MVVYDEFERRLRVRPQDSIKNESIRDVVGNKTDTAIGDSLIAQTKSIKEETNLIKTGTDNIETKQNHRTRLKYVSLSIENTDGTFDLVEADGGDIYIEDVLIYSSIAATDLTSVSILTDDTIPFIIMDSAEGVAENLVAEKTLKTTTSQKSFYLASGKKIQYIVEDTGTWSAYVLIKYRVQGSGDLV